MSRYRLTESRYKELKAMCLHPTNKELIERALRELGCPGMENWMRRHVCTSEWKWKRLEASGIPCSGDSFRLYRARFFWILNQLETGRKTMG
jgi:hypothetical protein